MIVPVHKVTNHLPISFSKLDDITIHIFSRFVTNSILGQPVANTDSYPHQQLPGPEKVRQHSWQLVTAQKLYV